MLNNGRCDKTETRSGPARSRQMVMRRAGKTRGAVTYLPARRIRDLSGHTNSPRYYQREQLHWAFSSCQRRDGCFVAPILPTNKIRYPEGLDYCRIGGLSRNLTQRHICSGLTPPCSVCGKKVCLRIYIYFAYTLLVFLDGYYRVFP